MVWKLVNSEMYIEKLDYMVDRNIVFVVNKKYISYLMVALSSLGKYNKYSINIFLVYSKLTNRNLKILKRLCDKFNYNFKPLKIKKYLFYGAPEMGHLKLENYYRLAIPNLIKSNSALYLDCDILIRANIRELFDIDLKGYALAAVQDPINYQPRDVLKMKDTSRYFNSGIILMNLEYWRQHELSNIILNFAIENHSLLLYADQCAINGIIGLDYISLNKTYNFQTDNIINGDEKNKTELNKSKIVHFTGPYKPMHYLNNHPFKKMYLNEIKYIPGSHIFILKYKILNFFMITNRFIKNTIKRIFFMSISIFRKNKI